MEDYQRMMTCSDCKHKDTKEAFYHLRNASNPDGGMEFGCPECGSQHLIGSKELVKKEVKK